MLASMPRVLRYSGVLAGLVAVALQTSTFVLLGMPPTLPLLVLAFFGVAGLYQIDRLGLFAPEDHINQPGRMAWARRHRRGLKVSAGIMLVGAMAMVPLLEAATVAVGLLLAVAGLAYVLPTLWGTRLKGLGGLKPVIVATVWTLGVVLLPALEANLRLDATIAALGTYRLALLWAATLLADYPDREGDWQAGLITPAVRWSRGTLWLVGCTPLALAGGLAAGLAVGYSDGLLALDSLGYLLLLYWLVQTSPAAPAFATRLDAFLLWPALTALAGLTGWL